MAEYCFQLLLIIVLSLLMLKFKKKFIFSFVTAFIYGNILDLVMWIVGFVPDGGMVQRVIFFIIGMLVCSLGVSMLFHTYISPEAYELFVKELSEKFGKNIHVVKTIYDCCSCVVAVIMSFAFFGLWHFQGVNIGTVICALLNGFIIGRCTHFFEMHFEFVDAFKMKKFFE